MDENLKTIENPKTIDILGTTYSVVRATDAEDAGLIEHDGYADLYRKDIVVKANILGNDPLSTQNLEAYKKKVIRHELIHAFLFESGMETWNRDEALVDWIAIQFPKLLKAIEALGAV